MNRRWMPLILVVAVFVLASIDWLAPSKTSQAAPAPSGEVSFKGKVLLVSTTNVYTGQFVLENVHVQKIGDRYWLTGKGADSGPIGRLFKGRTVRLQMDHIVTITEFDDLKDVKKALESGTATMIGGYGAVVPSAPSAEPLLPAPADKAKK
jgi:hypothetical protein